MFVSSLPHVHLSPGRVCITREQQVVVTVLGSCVALTMYDRRSGLAGICHAMLAEPAPCGSAAPDHSLRFRYVRDVLPYMLNEFRRAGTHVRSLEVKLFGGGNVIAGTKAGIGEGIGAANVAASREFLAQAGLQLVAENTGGDNGRKILFNTATGEVLHKFLRRQRR